MDVVNEDTVLLSVNLLSSIYFLSQELFIGQMLYEQDNYRSTCTSTNKSYMKLYVYIY